jgi:hypothetical protein
MTTTTTTHTRLPDIDLLCHCANEGSHTGLCFASELAERTPLSLRSPLLPPLLADADTTSVYLLSLA